MFEAHASAMPSFFSLSGTLSFRAKIDVESPDLPQYKDPLELSDHLESKKRKSVVVQVYCPTPDAIHVLSRHGKC